LNRLTVEATKKGVDRLNHHQNNAERRAILEWLSTTKFDLQQSDLISKRHKNTGDWILNTPEYASWRDCPGKTLYCPGIPGAGKTMITAICISDLLSFYRDDPNVVVVHWFCYYKSQHTLSTLMSILIRQVLERLPTLPDAIISLYESYKDSKRQVNLEELRSLLYTTSNYFKRIYILVDALDECTTEDNTRDQFLSEIFDFQKQAKIPVSVFATSRPLPLIADQFGGCMSVNISATKADVQTYIEDNISKMRNFMSTSVSLQVEITNQIIRVMDGM
jgi:hypothetical protein